MTDRALKLIPRNDRPHKLDVIGAALMVAAALLLLLALSWGGVRYPWGSVEILSLLVGSALLWAGVRAVAHDRAGAVHPARRWSASR